MAFSMPSKTQWVGLICFVVFVCYVFKNTRHVIGEVA